MTTKSEIRNEELDALKSIFNSDEFFVDGSEIKISSNIVTSDGNVVLKNAGDVLCSVKYLPPLILTCTLSDDYPSETPLQFSLECLWLSIHQLEEIATNLNCIQSENADCPVLFAWISFIQSEVPIALNLNECIDVSTLANSETDVKMKNFHLVNRFTNYEDLKSSLIEYDMLRKQRRFEESVFECQICLCMFKGRESIQLSCSHVFCNKCFSKYLKHMIKDGRVIDISCPQCDLVLVPEQIKANIEKEDYEVFESLTFDHALKTMSDVVYCPITECSSPVVIEKDEQLAICPKCHFSFCTLCKKTYHGRQNPCTFGNVKALAHEYMAMSKNQQELMVKKYGKYLLTLVDEVLAMEEIENTTKRCPKCRAAIEKNHGCNKMHCSNCNTNFCWLCLKVLSRDNPYEHFQSAGSSCEMKLFDLADLEDYL